ncbi:MAG: 1-(5-phosphoribosyl)-5-[(5-phosphoribosylamino)methylideneamino]imidazole-4-carboxamide isomerase [Fidelibacterota bacterium]|nr:MAG: 1-(5-phosphoribosyl)-5-[(5-phosphoribosylamino)methylideneamino]imidazole-4-carboxamide isomerase [Candidatus Neomarinimicrobiota bacterium]
MGNFKAIPAIDLMDGRCVRLVQGDYDRSTKYPQEPVELARLFLDAGLDWLHVVDLDGARTGKPIALATVKALATTGIGIELGGGIRTSDHIQQALNSGATNVILGSSLMSNRDDLPRWLDRFPGQLVAGVDARKDRVAVHGWQETTTVPALDLITRLEDIGFRRVIYTDIATDGTLAGPNLEGLRAVSRSTRMDVTASGGIGSVADIRAVADLAGLGVTGVIVGKAFYDGRISLEELATCLSGGQMV